MRIPHWCSYLVMGAALALSSSWLHADDKDTKKTTKAPPPNKAPAAAPKTAATGGGAASQTSQPVDTNHGQPAGKRVHESVAAPAAPSGTGATQPQPPPDTNTGQTTGRRMHESVSAPAAPSGTGATQPQPPPDTNTGHPTGRRVYEPATVAAPPSGASGGAGAHGVAQPEPGRGMATGRRAHEPVSIAPGTGSGGAVAVHTWQGRNGAQASIAADGSVRRVTTNSMTIVHAPGGGRQIVAVRPNHVVVVTNGAGHGYVQQPFAFRGHEYARRTFYYQGRPYVNYYRSYSFHNVYLVEYTPVRYYSPVFYGWAYHPWAVPVVYGGWGWYGSPWYSYYGGYFAPYRVYPSAAFWLTDYLLAASLQAAYQQQMDAQAAAQAYPAGGGPVALTPDVKQAISQEVQRQLALENAEGQQASQNIEPDPNSSGLPRMLADGASHVFVAASPLDVSDSTGQSCVVSEGDVLQLQGPPPQDASAAFLVVLASKNQDCPKGDVVTVAFADLQDMQNQMRAIIDGGLQQLQAKAGQGGLPAAPQGANAPPVQSPFAPIAPPPDPNAASELSQQAGAANTAEQQVISEAGAGGNQ